MKSAPVAGVYAITCVVNGKQYIGQSEDIEQRWALHRSQLRHGIHHSRYLQRSWAKHGENAFAFTILEIVADPTQERLNECEERYFDLLRPTYTSRPAGSQRGYTHRTDSRAKMRLAKLGKAPLIATAAAAEVNRGKQRSQEIRDKISATKRAANLKRPDLAIKNADPAYQARCKAGLHAYFVRRKALAVAD